MEQLDFDKSGTINMYEFDSKGQTSTAGGEDSGGAQVSNLQGSQLLMLFIIFNHLSNITF